MTDGIWITEVDARPPAGALRLAVKDNIDVAGVPTTAGCPAYAYVPERSASVVTRLVEGLGAVVVGKTNLDQFATGLTGSRSPYGVGRSALDPAYVSGGSSSGSALAVAHGLADLALGTDTAGSGRVPAACNGIVGFKPTPGLLPIDGIVPACRSLDCPSVFTRTVADARRALGVLAPGLSTAGLDVTNGRLRVGVPDEATMSLVHPAARAAFASTVATLPSADVVAVDLAPFLAVGDLLYGGAWVAERYHAVGAFLETHRDEVNDVVASVILGARGLTAAQAFGDQYLLADLAARCATALSGVDVLLTPTVSDVPTVAEVAADPFGTNVALGRFTTFANLLGLAVTSAPDAGRADGVPSGISVLASGGRDHLVLDVASLMMGEEVPRRTTSGVPLAVVGAHLSGQPLNQELLGREATLVQRTKTAQAYRLHALDTVPPKPGLVRVAAGEAGCAIEVEVWSMPVGGFGSFVAAVPAPLAIGKVELDDGSWVAGFVCEPAALVGAPDISSFGGWRRYLGAATA